MRSAAERPGLIARTRLALFDQFERRRAPFQIGADVAAWALALSTGWWLRMEFDLAQIAWTRLAVVVVFVAILQVAVGWAEGLYSGRHQYGSFEEVAGLVRTLFVTTFAVTLLDALMPTRIPVSVPIIGGFLALVVMAGTRYFWRIILEQSKRPAEDRAERVLVFGAGEGGAQLITSMLRDRDGSLLPVGLIDDDPRKRNLRIRGVPVLGSRDRLPTAVEMVGASVVAIAVPSANGTLIREVSEVAAAAGCRILVLPPVGELLGRPVDVGALRGITPADLLGRHEIDIDVAAIAGYVTGKRVLVTGAGGSIGSELSRQLHRFAPDALILLDRDESALHAVELSIHGRALLDRGDLVVADIRDEERMREVFEIHRPEVVFHAAALKHLTLLEQHPMEGIKTNVLGTLAVLEASLKFDVQRFVNISTDKAADPISVLGHTKRIAERLTAWAATQSDGTYLSVRFGNVLGSRGSMLSTFSQQIEGGGPVTVTDPDVTRFFMTVEEAVRLVIQAGAIGRDGEALVLDMGEPVRIADVAKRLIEESGKSVRVDYTGLRPGEKLHEVLLGDREPDVRPAHPLVSHVPVPPLMPADVGSAEEFLTQLEAVTSVRWPHATDAGRRAR
jgi:FlaA1/EpsC-like NDP-sugar epimerase